MEISAREYQTPSVTIQKEVREELIGVLAVIVAVAVWVWAWVA